MSLGFDVNNFSGYEIFFEPVKERGNILDNDFFGDNENYSLIIKGSVNGDDFTFRSAGSFKKLFEIDNVVLSTEEETLVLRKSINLREVFTGSEGHFLHPETEENRTLIMANIVQHLRVEAAAESLLN